ncbi:methyl-accepting chemotaxis protein [Lysinibacillus sp. BW-2-10]|uniref:methyl-accepting chemotaxis protein n=1 Tax=Lysinibacillus sp. BW-2-10 TaxID=2590030 RepID=UPI0011806E48|nr:methyl-accepting chemotaxis protein [Lysinibacillus sp. BW-2-10]TSI04494.1 HAMP domain-containing protein [Lysinibacillus sp. BW-2-10]
MTSIKAKLISIFLTLSIIPLVIATSIIFFVTDKGLSFLIEDQQQKMIHNVQYELDTISKDLLAITSSYSKNAQIVSSFKTGSRSELLNTINPTFQRLQDEHQLTVFELGEVDGTVALRGHNPLEYGDNKSDVGAIQKALKGETLSGFEYGKSGLSVRAFSPIVENNKIIGTLQTSINSNFIEKLSSKLEGTIITLYNQDGSVMYSSATSDVKQLDSEVLTHIFKGNISTHQQDDTLESIVPLYDPTGAEVIGGIGINQNISVMSNVKQQILVVTTILVALTIIIVVISSILFSRSISKPIIQLADTMDELSNGNLQVNTYESTRKDEIGHLLNATHQMKTNIYTTIEKVAYASKQVATQSNELKEAANEFNAGSQQIAFTMNEISAGADSQANNMTDLASMATDFSTSIQYTNNNGLEMNYLSNEVLEHTNTGKQLMHSSSKQMQKIDGIMIEAVKKMQNLEIQTKEISTLVTVIQDVANQTNLLALNASIEAARAKEHGAGFSVVADEVRKLADQVSNSISNITHIVASIQHETKLVETSLKDGYSEIKLGNEQIQSTEQTFQQITHSISGMVEKIQFITHDLSENMERSKHMSVTIDDVASISEETAAAVEQTAATTQQFNSSIEEITKSTEELSILSDELNDLVQHFKL